MTTYGITPTGFVPKTQQVIQGEIESDQHTRISQSLDVSSDQPLGQNNGIFSEKLAEVWELVGTVVGMFNRKTAENTLLDNDGALIGVPRNAATATVVACTVNLNAGVTLPLGTKAYVDQHSDQTFHIQAPVTNSGGSPANISAVFVADNTGPIAVQAGTLTHILTPVTGWNSITNAVAGTTGTNIETDTAYRVRQDTEIAALGSCDLDAIVAAVQKVTGVIQAFGFENTTLVGPDANGLPAKSFMIVVWDGTSPAASNIDIANAIWSEKPSGVQSVGTTNQAIIDKNGVSRVISFSRATQVPIYFTYSLHKDPVSYAGDQAQKDAIVAAFTATQKVGVEVRVLQYQSIPIGVVGNGPLTDVPVLALGTSPSPVGTANIVLSGTSIATLNPANITINYV